MQLADAPLVEMDLNAFRQQIKQEKAWQNSDRNAITIFKTSGMRLVLVALHQGAEVHVMTRSEAARELEPALQRLNAARPTAVNLAWALARMRAALLEAVSERTAALLAATLLAAASLWSPVPTYGITTGQGGTGRPGDRHPMAVTLHWAATPTPRRATSWSSRTGVARSDATTAPAR